MLLQIICNPYEEYQLNLNKATSSQRFSKQSQSRKTYGYTPKSKYEEQKGYESEESSKGDDKSADYCGTKKPNEGLISFAKRLFYEISNTLPTNPRRNEFYGPSYQRTTYIDTHQDRERQSIKLSSLFLYLSRVLQPIFSNYLIFLSSLRKKAECYPNMGVSEKRVCGSKLNNFLKFIKNEEKYLKSLGKEIKDSKGYREYENEAQNLDFNMNYESIIHQESQQIDHLKAFILRCIISIEFLEEISKVPQDFSEAITKLTSEERGVMESIQFKHLTRDISNEKCLKSFIKRLLEVKAEK